MSKSVVIIGAGFSGISAAAYAAKKGYSVTVFEQHSVPGGRARQFTTDNGYAFDMGPSWYWMPDVINKFFKDFGVDAASLLELVRLDPQFEMVFKDGTVAVPDNQDALGDVIESLEGGGKEAYRKFMSAAQSKYDIAMGDFIELPCKSITEFMKVSMLSSAFKLDLFTDIRSYISKYFKTPKVQALMEFPVIFLGASPNKIPAMYSMMNYGGYGLGTWYPMGGFYAVVQAMYKVAQQQGVHFEFNTKIEKIHSENGRATTLETSDGTTIAFDELIGAADYHHIENLLEPQFRNYDEKYWSKKTFAPSCLIWYLGLNRALPNLKHHTLFFENPLDKHIGEIYEHPQWPSEPLFYVCCPSKTDTTVAPAGHENLFLLMPIAIGIDDSEAEREKYLKLMLERIERKTGIENLHSYIDYKKSYCVRDFMNDYNAYKGNAYGLANTLKQTAILKPTLHNKKLKNVHYAGQLTVPGPGVPPSIISGKIVSNLI